MIQNSKTLFPGLSYSIYPEPQSIMQLQYDFNQTTQLEFIAPYAHPIIRFRIPSQWVSNYPRMRHSLVTPASLALIQMLLKACVVRHDPVAATLSILNLSAINILTQTELIWRVTTIWCCNDIISPRPNTF